MRLFGAPDANVQPHSGTSANIAALVALAGARGRILGMALKAGGHLTHGHDKSQVYEQGKEPARDRGRDMQMERERVLENH